MTPTREPWVITYDVADDKRRTRLARYLEAHGHRVQFSVFEVLATQVELDQLLERALASERFDPSMDSLRVYPLCGRCAARTQVRGTAPDLLSAEKAIVL